MSGEQWGQYIADEKIGAGGMADVFRGRRVGAAGFKRVVCIKRIRQEFTNDANMLRLFRDEAMTGQHLDHKNIVRIEDVAEHEGRLQIVMEFVNGKNLREIENALRSTGTTMPLDAALFIAHELLAALKTAHNAVGPDRAPLHIVHRDVSPANTMVSFTGEVKLTDFGIARARTREYQTEDGTARGQPLYMPLEQLDGAVDGRTDLFALGGVLFELLARRLPFGDGRPPASVHAAVLLKVNDTRVSLGTVRPDLPPALIALVDRMLAKEPDGRPSSAQEAIDVVCSFPEFATGSRSLQLLMEQLFPAQGSIAAIPIDSALRNSRSSGVPAVPANDSTAMPITVPDATIPDQSVQYGLAEHTVPARPGIRTGPDANVDAYAATTARPSLMVVADDVSAPPVDVTRTEVRPNDRRGVPAWTIALAAAVILGGSAIAITATRKSGGASAAPAPAVATSESGTTPPTTVLAPSAPTTTAATTAEPSPTVMTALPLPPVAGSNTHAVNPSAHSATHATTPVVQTTNATTPIDPSANPPTSQTAPPSQSQPPPSDPAPQPMGTLRVVALPWGEVLIDGTSRGRAPVNVRVTAGEHVVRITGGVEHTERVVVSANATRTVTAEGD